MHRTHHNSNGNMPEQTTVSNKHTTHYTLDIQHNTARSFTKQRVPCMPIGLIHSGSAYF